MGHPRIREDYTPMPKASYFCAWATYHAMEAFWMPWVVLLWHRTWRQHDKVPPIRAEYLDRSRPIGVLQSAARTHSVHNHYALSCLGPCQVHDVDISLGQLNHYRTECQSNLLEFCQFEEKERDTTVWMVKDQVIANSLTTLRNINITTKADT